MLLVKSTDRTPRLFSCPALLTEVCGDAAVPRSSCCGVVSRAQLCLPAVQITWIFTSFWGFCFVIKLQLSCRNVKNVKSRAAGLLGVESAVSMSEGGLYFTNSSFKM